MLLFHNNYVIIFIVIYMNELKSSIKITNENILLDIFKFFACLLIVGSHCMPLFANDTLNFYYWQWFFRFCVPFFLMSAGFYFERSNNNNRKKIIVRLFKLYLFTLILYLPFIIKPPYNIFEILKLVLFGYFHLWYIISLLYALLILYFVYKHNEFKISVKLILVIIVLIIISSYIDEYHKIYMIPFTDKIVNFFINNLFGGRNFLLFSIPMILIGMCISNFSKKHNFNKKCISLLLLLSFVISFAECYYMKKYIGPWISNDITMFNFFPAIFILIIAISCNRHINLNTKFIRKVSNIIYIIHIFIIYYVSKLLSFSGIKLFIYSYIICLIISIFYLLILNVIKKRKV